MQADKWSKNDLKWIYLNQTGLVNQTRMRYLIHKALHEWGQYTPLTFTEVSVVTEANIKISFQRGDHFDSYPFDGTGGTMGHAFYPPDGRVHLDMDESWDDDKLFRTLVHEFGHTLGLGHKVEQTMVDIMFPVYLDFVNAIGPDDIAGIQFLYGSKPIATTTTTMRHRITTTMRPRITTTMRHRITTTMRHRITTTMRPRITTTMRPKITKTLKPSKRRKRRNYTFNIINSSSPIIFILNRGSFRHSRIEF
ncbi:MAG: matrixin family metalloprotease [Nitrosomonadales bacterium]|nr:MAG: matrixin family metalloprotease [Nitrosomonadales bacterium]